MLEYAFILIFISVTALAGFSLNLLSMSGSLAALIIGIAVGWGFGLRGLLVLGFFFASSSLWSKFKRKQKLKVEDRHEKGSRRDWHQVAANGGIAGISSLLYLIDPSSVWLMCFLISLASANSDTWASEIGSLSKKLPLSIRTFKPIETGTSGAVSLLGTFAAIAGASAIALLSFYLFHITPYEALFILAFGFAGNIIDSFLGAYLQAVYKCNVCGEKVEKLNHCEKKTSLIGGKQFADNDFVNFFSGLASAALGMLLYILIL
ncbi:DUF92 domain-containing protein [Bacillus sp. ISL-47]|uniref:DUF92 domain-containing protein n=1 Tax=Bacillus sp. ISL-47 TaxID=2819130 RepID=UPI001BE7C860|nr:DUF92 domain-containing protein [Bacillus sp. ISL-47]MBT2687132.1 DUF92 domain-containing protein [Bacillus sp. ISL-47]MBT2710482.1 DUF92 domain-containing protein [Pseudomonas sp. ISL-84]